jgi:hypothetical protein
MVARQGLFSPDIFTNHPPSSTDSFTLLLKSFILLSRVVSFNIRAKSPNRDREGTFNVAEHPAFKNLDNLLYKYRLSFPARFRNGFKALVIDPVLYLADIVPLA